MPKTVEDHKDEIRWTMAQEWSDIANKAVKGGASAELIGESLMIAGVAFKNLSVGASATVQWLRDAADALDEKRSHEGPALN